MLDVNGEAVQLEYDLDNSVQTVRDIYGNPTTYVYDNRGNVLTEIDPVGLRTVRTYDERNNVLTETMITAESGPQGWTTTYTYDGQNNQLSETDPLGRTTYYTYGQYGRLLTETDPLGNTTTYDYDSRGNLLSSADSLGNVTNYAYDHRGNLLNLTAGENTTNFDYYSDGNVRDIADPDGNTGNYTYTPNGDLQRETIIVQTPDGPQEIVTEWTYDSEGRIVSIIQGDNTTEYRYDSNGNQTAVITGESRTDYIYNEKGQLVTTVYPDETPDNVQDNPRTVTLYDKGGRERATVDRDGQVTYYEYDAAGRLTATIYPDEATNQVEQLLSAITFLNGYVPPSSEMGEVDWTQVVYPDIAPTYLASRPRNSTEYTQDGRIKAEIDEQGNRIEYQYDPIGRQTEIRYDDNNYITYTYDTAGNRRSETYYAEGTTWSNTYDPLGQLTASTDQNGQTTQYEYNDRGQLTAVINPLNGRTEYEYDDNGNLTSIKDALNQVTQYEYDAQGRPAKTTLPDGKVSTTTYDDDNNAITVTDFNGDSIRYVYDEFGQLQRKELLSEGTSVTYAYNDTERTETITSSRGTTVYKYDELGNLISRTDPEGPYSSNGTSIKYTYEDGNLTSVSTPNRTVGYAYNDDGTLSSVTTPQGTTTYTYDSEGNLERVEFPNNIIETRTYDPLGRLDLVQTVRVNPDTGAEEEVISSFDYDTDNAGNRLEVQEEDGRRVEYDYDELNRVTQERIIDPANGNRTITYTYDAVGNLDYKSDSVEGDTDYVYNNRNQLISSVNNGTTTTYSYDDNGNLVARNGGSTSMTYDWENDGENRLVGVTINDGSEVTEIEYEYNEQGIRVGKTVDGVETNYLIDELRPYAQVVEEYDALGNPVASYTYGLDLISQQRNGVSSFYHTDGLGSTRALTDGTGSKTQTYSYDAYGNLIAGSVGENPYLFAGEQRDSETGLDYLRARYYDPSLGRFISRDAYSGTLDDPMSLHKYQYAHANPVVNTDPSGYVTNMQEFFAVSALLAISAGLGNTTGAAIGTVATGGSFLDAAALYDQFFAGFADLVTFGTSTKARKWRYGETATKNHRGVFFNLGRLSGGVARLGFSLATPPILSVGGASVISWGEVLAVSYTSVAQLIGAYSSTRKILEDRDTWWDWLVFAPLLISVGGKIWNVLKGFGRKPPSTPAKGACFVAGTKVLTPEGEKFIENLAVGDTVISTEPITGEVENHQIKHKFSREVSTVLDIQIGDTTITCSPEHPFWVVGQGWQEASKLESGMQVVTHERKEISIDLIQSQEGTFTVYNIEVEGFHTYFVSSLGLLVHNKSASNPTGFSNEAEQAIQKFHNLKNNVLGDINRQSNHNHYNAARREALGEVVARRPDGTPFDHIGELKEAFRGLQNVRKVLEREMYNLPPSLTSRGLEVLLQKHTEVQSELSRLKGFLTSIGHKP